MTDVTAITESAKLLAVDFPAGKLTAGTIIDYALEDADVYEYSLGEPECRKIVSAYRTACLDNERARRAELEADDDDVDTYTGDDLPIVVRADGIIDVIENPCNITTVEAEYDRAMRDQRDAELRAAGVDMESLAKLEGSYNTMLQQRGIHWGAGDVDSESVRVLTVAIDLVHAEIVKVRGY